MPARTLAWIATALLCLFALYANVSPDFTPIRSELANARGFSRGLMNGVVLPVDAPFSRVPAWSFVVCAVSLLLGIRCTSGSPGRSSPRSRPWWALAGGASAALLIAAVVSPFVTRYRIVLAPRTFVLLLVLVLGARLFDYVRPLLMRWTPLMTGAVAAVFFASAMLQTLSSYDGNYSGFLHVARDVADAAPYLEERPDIASSLIVYDAGYDGQFMYLMAFDPFLGRFADRPQAYRAFIDNPPYRYGRIGFSAITSLLAFGRPERFPAGMMWLIVAAHLALATLLASIASRHGMSPAAGLWYLAIPAFISSLMSALPEALAAAGLVAGFLCWEVRRPWLAALSFAVALLVRETGIVLIIALVLAGGIDEWRRSRIVLLGALLPVAMWRLFVASRLYQDFGWAAIATNPGDLGIPFAGLMRLWQAGAGGTQSGSEAIGALLFPMLLAAALTLSVVLTMRATTTDARGVALAASVYAVVAVSLNYEKIWSHLPSGERGTFELFLCLLILMLQGSQKPAWARQALTTFFAVLCVYTFFVAPDAGTSRSALLLIR